MKVVIVTSIHSANTSISIVLNHRSLLLSDNPITCHFGRKEKVSLMTGKGLNGEEINFSHGNRRDQYADQQSTNTLKDPMERKMLIVHFKKISNIAYHLKPVYLY